MIPYELDDIPTGLDLSLNHDETIFGRYEETPLSQVVDGYRVENYRGLDIGVLAYPSEIDVSTGGSTIAYQASFQDEHYEAVGTISPEPIEWDEAFETDEELNIGSARHIISSTPYVQLQAKHEPSQVIKDLIDRRGDIASGAQSVVGDYIKYDVEDETPDGLVEVVRTSLQGKEDEDPVTVTHDRAEQLAQNFL